MLSENILMKLECDVYKYNYSKNCFQIRNYFKTDNTQLLVELEKIIKILKENTITFKILKDNSIQLEA